ncbi:MAG: hypothetical protein ACXU8A_14095 [Burkholderiaceae bacterium]
MATKQPLSQTDTTARKQINSSKQSATDAQNDDGRFPVAEEVNLDQQSDKERHIGQLSLDWGEVEGNDMPAVDTSLKSKQKNTRKAKREEKLKQSINRTVPPSQ